MSWLLLLACGAPEAPPAPSEAPAVIAQPTADEVLARHVQVTRQCELLQRGNYAFTWTNATNDGHSKPRTERVRAQGEPGKSFTRVHQHLEPLKRFVAFGIGADGKGWSAGEGAIQTELPPEMTTSLQSQLDPTPLCNWGARWAVREMRGPDTFMEFPAWHLELVWADGTSTDMWFHRESGMLMGSKNVVGEATTTTSLTDYGAFPCASCTDGQPVLWPQTETAVREQGPVKITTTQKLVSLAIDDPGYAAIGPVEVARVLTVAAAEAAQNPPPAPPDTP